jgi:hypothetical protein
LNNMNNLPPFVRLFLLPLVATASLLSAPVPGAPADQAPDDMTVLHLGLHEVRTTKHTASGVAVVPMWSVPVSRRGDPEEPVPAANVEHHVVWAATDRSEGAYNHFSALCCHKDRLFAMWANHWFGEYGPGQRALFSSSGDGGKTWSAAAPLFPPPGPIGHSGETGIYLTPDRWVTLGDRLYAVANVVSNETNYLIAREVREGGGLGPVFLVKELPEKAELPVFMPEPCDLKAQSPEALSIRKWYADNGVASWWGAGLPRTAADKAHMIEPVRYRAGDGVPVLIQRSMPVTKSDPQNNHRLYVSFGDSSGGWSVPQPTDIPDSPSRSEVITLNKGTYLLIGNHIARQLDRWDGYLPRDPLTVALSRDGYSFDRVFSVRAKAPTQPRFSGLRRRCPGFGYPSSVIFHGYICILYSIGKEDISLSRVPLSSLGISQ